MDADAFQPDSEDVAESVEAHHVDPGERGRVNAPVIPSRSISTCRSIDTPRSPSIRSSRELLLQEPVEQGLASRVWAPPFPSLFLSSSRRPSARPVGSSSRWPWSRLSGGYGRPA